MKRTNTNSLRRNQSIRYVQNEDERPVLTFGSLDKGDVEEDEDEGYHKSNIFTYNSNEDIYKLKTLKNSNINNPNIDVIKEEVQIDDFNYKLYSDVEKAGDDKEKMHGGNIIFANLINIDLISNKKN